MSYKATILDEYDPAIDDDDLKAYTVKIDGFFPPTNDILYFIQNKKDVNNNWFSNELNIDPDQEDDPVYEQLLQHLYDLDDRTLRDIRKAIKEAIKGWEIKKLLSPETRDTFSDMIDIIA
jgi:hypothetical protein